MLAVSQFQVGFCLTYFIFLLTACQFCRHWALRPESKIILTMCTESQSSELSSASQGFCSIMGRDFRSYLICLLCFLRNWYVDEPSCGSEICVVMYHQPSAPPGVGGPYMFQWNDDRCNMKNNFICKYPLGNESFYFKKQPAPSPQEEV